MSTTMEGIDARGYLIGWLKGVTSMYITDVKAIPEDKWTATFGGCTRPCNELTADAINLLIWIAGELSGNPVAGDPREQVKQLTAEVGTKETAIAKLVEATDNFAAALAGASDEKLNEVVTPPWQMPAPIYVLCQIAVSHIWYHDGQLNYVQCLLGDANIHWMES